MMKNLVSKTKMSESYKKLSNKNLSSNSIKKIHSSSLKRKTIIISNKKILALNIKRGASQERSTNKKIKNNSLCMNEISNKKCPNIIHRNKRIHNNSIHYITDNLSNDYSKLNINNELKNMENNKYNKIKGLYLSINNSNDNFNNKFKMKKYNTLGNEPLTKKKNNVLFSNTHYHFNSAVNTFDDSKFDRINTSKKNGKISKEYYKNCSLKILQKNYANSNNREAILLLNNKTNNENRSHKFLIDKNNIFKKIKTNPIIRNINSSKSSEKIKRKSFSNHKKITKQKSKKIINSLIINKINNYTLNYENPNTTRETITQKLIKLLKFKKDNFFKKDIYTKKQTKSNNDLNDNLNIQKFKKYIPFKTNIKNSKQNFINKKTENNNMENGMIEKMKKKIIVIKKHKKLHLQNNINDDFNSRSLTERKNEKNYNESNLKNRINNNFKRFITFENNKNEKNNDNLAIFEIISNTKIKSMIEYEKEKEKERINDKIIKENFNANNNSENMNYNKNELNDFNLIMKKNDSKDTFSFRPTNNDSRLILEQELKNENEFINKANESDNNIFLEFGENPLNSKEKQKIKIIKRKDKKLCK